MVRLLDILFASIGLVVLSPLLAVAAIAVRTDSPGRPFFRQQRIGKHGTPFWLYKVRTMTSTQRGDQAPQITVAGDQRVTRVGAILRRTKIDELPQLWNVVRGDMSLVGPRPEVPRYVELYDDNQRRVLAVRPGITDLASLEYLDEEAILAESPDPERHYRDVVMPEKLALNFRYTDHPTVYAYLSILASTLKAVAFRALATGVPTQLGLRSVLSSGLLVLVGAGIWRGGVALAVVTAGMLLGADQLGLIGWVQATAGSAGVFFGASAGLVLTKLLAETQRPRRRLAMVGGASVAAVGLTCLMSAVLIVGAPWLSEVGVGSDGATPVLRCAAILAIGSTVSMAMAGALVGLRMGRSLVSSALLASSVVVIVTPVLASVWGVTGVVSGMAVGTLWYAGCLATAVRRRLGGWPNAADSLAELWPLMKRIGPASLLFAVAAPTDLLCMTIMAASTDIAELGVYVAANQVFLLCRLVIAAVSSAALSEMSASQHSASRLHRRLAMAPVFVGMPLAILGSVAAAWAPVVMGDGFQSLDVLVRWMMLTALAFAASQAWEKVAVANDQLWTPAGASVAWSVVCVLGFSASGRGSVDLAMWRTLAYTFQFAVLFLAVNVCGGSESEPREVELSSPRAAA